MTRIPIDDENQLDEESGQEGARETAAAPGAGPSAGGGTDEARRLREERDTYYDRWVRSKADAENMRKRMQAEFDTRLQYANQSLIKSLLPVIDNFERALAVDPAKADTKAILKGLQLVHDQWISVLKQQNTTEIAPTPGTPFDVTAGMEAVMQQPAPPELAGKGQVVTQTFAKGYKLGDRVLRPAQVAVSQNS